MNPYGLYCNCLPIFPILNFFLKYRILYRLTSASKKFKFDLIRYFKFLKSLARTPEIGPGLERILSCGARKPEQT